MEYPAPLDGNGSERGVSKESERVGGSEYALLLFLGAIWGSAFPVIRIGLLAGASPLIYAGVRCAVGALGLALLGALLRQRVPDRKALVLSATIGGTLTMGGYFAFLYIGEEVVPGGLASILVATNPLWSALFMLLLVPTDRLGTWGAAGILAGFAGVSLIFLPEVLGGSQVGWGALAEVAVAPALFALGTVLFRKFQASQQGLWGISTQLAAGGAVLLVASPLIGEPTALPLTAGVWAPFAFLVLVPTCVGYVVYFHLHHRLGPTQANLVSFVSPISGLLVGLAALREVPTSLDLAGFALVAVGLFLVGRPKDRGTPKGGEGAAVMGSEVPPARPRTGAG